MSRSRSAVAMVVLLLSVVACAGGQPGATATSSADPASTWPFHAIPADSVPVYGTAVCDLGMYEVECELDMSDPRVSGTERHEGLRYFARGMDGRVWVTENAVITNATGSWRGRAQAAETNAGIPAGEAHYSGEGAYAGLEFHYYFWHAELSGPADLRGWISNSV